MEDYWTDLIVKSNGGALMGYSRRLSPIKFVLKKMFRMFVFMLKKAD